MGKWENDGPILPIEFTRISDSRNGALTLVIDPDNGSQVRTKYTLSKRKEPEDTACDLRTREGTVIRHIGLIDLEKVFYRGHWSFIIDKIKLWATEKKLHAVVWTDLPSNYTKKTQKIFKPDNAIDYLKNLPIEGQESAKEYIRNAQSIIKTSFMTMVIEDQWFKEESIANK
ncbi:MAG: hypothetical protein K8S16_06345 [Bacteroidales bacterium]|nr:hypothetical protein [Bacteroidales bacterium]